MFLNRGGVLLLPLVFLARLQTVVNWHVRRVDHATHHGKEGRNVKIQTSILSPVLLNRWLSSLLRKVLRVINVRREDDRVHTPSAKPAFSSMRAGEMHWQAFGVITHTGYVQLPPSNRLEFNSGLNRTLGSSDGPHHKT